MYNQEVYEIISKLKERIKDKDLEHDLNMLSLYSEQRSNALAEYEQKERFYKNKLHGLSQDMDSADAAIDMLEFSNARLRQHIKRSTTSSGGITKPSFDDQDED